MSKATPNTTGRSRSATKLRALTNLFNKLEPELTDLDFKTQEFICQVCSAYERGSRRDMRNSYREVRKWLKKITRDLEKVKKECTTLKRNVCVAPNDGFRSRSLLDDIREAHKPWPHFVSVLELAGLTGPVAYFRERSLPDPAQNLRKLVSVLIQTESFINREIETINNGIYPKIQALWKTRPILWWQKGGFEYILERLLRERFRLSLKEAHRLVVRIRYKLDGKRLRLDEEKGYAPGVRKRINDMESSYKKQCDQVLSTLFGLPFKS